MTKIAEGAWMRSSLTRGRCVCVIRQWRAVTHMERVGVLGALTRIATAMTLKVRTHRNNYYGNFRRGIRLTCQMRQL